MTGLKRGSVKLCSNQKEWALIASGTIKRLGDIFGGAAYGIEHVGSTSIPRIQAKPIIDIAVAVESLDDVVPLLPALEQNGFIHR